MRCVKDMRVGEVGYCVDWAVHGDEINGGYSVVTHSNHHSDTQICRYDGIVFSVHLASGHVFARLKEAKEPCLFD